MWVEFVVGCRPCSEGFSLGTPVFLPPQKPTLLNSNNMESEGHTGLSDARLLSDTLVKQSRFIFSQYLFIYKLILFINNHLMTGNIMVRQ